MGLDARQKNSLGRMVVGPQMAKIKVGVRYTAYRGSGTSDTGLRRGGPIWVVEAGELVRLGVDYSTRGVAGPHRRARSVPPIVTALPAPHRREHLPDLPTRSCPLFLAFGLMALASW